MKNGRLSAAITNSEMCAVADSLNPAANAHNEGEIDDLKKQLLELRERLRAPEERFGETRQQ